MTSTSSIPRQSSAFAARAAVILIGALLLAWPAIYNHSPLMLGDSTDYLTSAISGAVNPIRPSFYPYFLRVCILSGTVFFVCIGQSLLLAATLEIFLRRCLRFPPRLVLVVLAFLAATTTAPWWASMMMSDVFFGIAAVALCTLTCPGTQVAVTEFVFLAAILVASMLTHIAMPPVIFLMAACLIIRGLMRRRPMRQALTLPALAAVAALMCMGAYPLLGRLAKQPAQPNDPWKFIVARMLGDGSISRADLAADFAAARTVSPAARTKILADYDRIRREKPDPATGFISPQSATTALFLHDPESPLEQWPRNPGLPTFRRLAALAVSHHPVRAASAIVRGIIRLLRMPEMTWYLEQPPVLGPILGRTLKQPFPADFARYTASPQANGRLHLHFWNAVILAVYWSSALLYFPLLILLFRRRRDPAARAAEWLGSFMLAIILLHALLVYTLSGDFPRYQGRVSWLLVFGAAAMAVAALRPAVEEAPRNSCNTVPPAALNR